jgi:hypothetical protein
LKKKKRKESKHVFSLEEGEKTEGKKETTTINKPFINCRHAQHLKDEEAVAFLKTQQKAGIGH